MKPIRDFAKDASKRSGRKAHCRVCDTAKVRAYYAQNREQVLARINAKNRAAARRRGARICKRCDQPATSNRHHLCDNCREAQLRRTRTTQPRKPHSRSTAQRGYGTMHQTLRKRWARKVNRGTVRCARCKRLIVPHEEWDLGHDDHDRRKYTGPEHAYCNRSAAARKKNGRAARRKSRDW